MLQANTRKMTTMLYYKLCVNILTTGTGVLWLEDTRGGSGGARVGALYASTSPGPARARQLALLPDSGPARREAFLYRSHPAPARQVRINSGMAGART